MAFYSCIRSKQETSADAVQVKNTYDVLTSSAQETAEEQKKFFKSVYVNDNSNERAKQH
jgi:hypothetical protein